MIVGRLEHSQASEPAELSAILCPASHWPVDLEQITNCSQALKFLSPYPGRGTIS